MSVILYITLPSCWKNNTSLILHSSKYNLNLKNIYLYFNKSASLFITHHLCSIKSAVFCDMYTGEIPSRCYPQPQGIAISIPNVIVFAVVALYPSTSQEDKLDFEHFDIEEMLCAACDLLTLASCVCKSMKFSWVCTEELTLCLVSHRFSCKDSKTPPSICLSPTPLSLVPPLSSQMCASKCVTDPAVYLQLPSRRPSSWASLSFATAALTARQLRRTWPDRHVHSLQRTLGSNY